MRDISFHFFFFFFFLGGGGTRGGGTRGEAKNNILAPDKFVLFCDRYCMKQMN